LPTAEGDSTLWSTGLYGVRQVFACPPTSQPSSERLFQYVECAPSALAKREEDLSPAGLSLDALAAVLDLPAARIHEIVKERRAVGVDTA